jgi:DNA invertase Pin-like site-specific DNA recombinase
VSDGVALYLRVSTEEQDLAGQERELRAYAGRKGWTVACVYAEKVSASGRVERAEHDALLQEAASSARGWRRVLVWSLDRWSRDPSFVAAVGSIEQLEKAGVKFHSLREPSLDSGEDDAPNLERNILRGILATIAVFEARRRSDRTKVAMDEIRSGRRPTKSGKQPGHQAVLTEEKVAKILEMRRRTDPVPYARIAQEVGLREGTVRSTYSLASRGLLALATPHVGKGDRSEAAPSGS